MHVTCERTGTRLDLPTPPQRIVSLVSSATEALAALGAAPALVGVSPYCRRYVPDLAAPVAGDYLEADPERLRALQPDLVLLTAGIQLPLARRLAAAGLPVYVLPLPTSRFGMWEGFLTLGALTSLLPAARRLVETLEARCQRLLADPPRPRPRIYVELWLGRYRRAVGGHSFIHDLITVAGGQNLFEGEVDPYPQPDLADIPARQPDVAVFFSEPDFPVDARAALHERGWDRQLPGLRLLESSVARGRNLIHDGPSFVDTAEWLHAQLLGDPAP